LTANTLKDDEATGSTMLLVLPYDLYLPAGVKLQIGNNDPVIVEIETSDQNGSYANIELRPLLLNNL